MTITEIKEELDKLGVEYSATKKVDLEKLLEDSQKLEAPTDKPKRLKQEIESLDFEVEGDYLRQYQVRKQTKPGSVESDPDPKSRAGQMKAYLLKQKKVSMFIPREPGESKQIKLPVNLNGYRLDFPKNKYIEVPQGMADVMKESLEQTEEAIERNQISSDSESHTADEKQTALT